MLTDSQLYKIGIFQTMIAAPKYILHSPVNNSADLVAFVERCLVEKASLLAIVGTGSTDLEDTIDDLVVGNGEDTARFLCTTSHPEEPFNEVFSFVQNWEIDQAGKIFEIRL